MANMLLTAVGEDPRLHIESPRFLRRCGEGGSMKQSSLIPTGNMESTYHYFIDMRREVIQIQQGFLLRKQPKAQRH